MRPAGNTRTVLKLVAVVAGMGALAWASVPLYDLFCRVTGYAGTTRQVTTGSDVVLDREVTIRFDASLGAGMSWEFQPVKRTMKVRIGETALAFYEATNPTDRPITGSATFNVTPLSAGQYFSKIDCFCFTEQTLQPGETVTMPVTFYVDPAMVDDQETAGITTITLSYTFYQIEPEPTAAKVPETTDNAARGG